MRQHTSAYVSIRQHTSAYVSIRQHTSAYLQRVVETVVSLEKERERGAIKSLLRRYEGRY